MDGSPRIDEDPSPEAARARAEARAAETPMMRQFWEVKADAGDALLFFRMGDFYELFFEDAVKAAAALDIALTKRGKHRGEDVAMCGVPVHAYERYLATLIRKGFKVAICEQIEDPAEAKKRGAKSVVARGVVRRVTPGTLTEEALLEARAFNHLAVLSVTGKTAALAWADLSTGDLAVRETGADRLPGDLAEIAPREIVLPDALLEDPLWGTAIDGANAATTPLPAQRFEAAGAERVLKETFDVSTLDGYGSFSMAEIAALGALVDYAVLTQVEARPAFKAPKRVATGAAMAIDAATRASLELVAAREGGRAGSLLAAVDRTVTGPGARELAARIAAPLTDVSAIRCRLDAVERFVADRDLREGVRAGLKATPDAARALSRLALGRAGPRDLLAIAAAVAAAADIAGRLTDAAQSAPLGDALDLALARLAPGGGVADVRSEIDRALTDAPPLLARDGGFVAGGYDERLDAARALSEDARRVIAEMQAALSEETNVRTLKIKHNNMLGYFIEVPAAAGKALAEPPHSERFIHRQTMANAMRFTTPELSELAGRIVRARDEALALELTIFGALRERVLDVRADISALAEALAEIDCVGGLAEYAEERSCVRPAVEEGLAFEIREGRHPVVEQALAGGARFSPNDCVLSSGEEARLKLVTGPNMAGKSTYLRQNALIAVLAQAGAFVPAAAARIGVVDRLFSRVGAADDLARGRSTFMVEMIETAAILNQAGPKSLVVLDEIGRGTATFDGLSIAWAALEHLHDANKCRGLFATHYHELTQLSERLARLDNVSMRVREWKGEIVFLHEVADGPADRSYGVAVARLAGVPARVVKRAAAVLKDLEAESAGGGALPLFSAGFAEAEPAPSEPSEVERRLASLDVDGLSPREALEALYELKAALETGE
ncbi:MAG: DNA mismatch repair protein MutS [Pseudomonadota bacterium]